MKPAPTTPPGHGYGIAPPGYRLPAASRIGMVRLQVSDLERSLAWYARVLGLVPLERAIDRAVLGAAGHTVGLLELHERPGATPVPRRGRLGLYHYALLLPGRPELGRLLRHLQRTGERVGMSDHLVSEALYLTDPDGLGIEAYADRPREAWRVNAGQLAMAIDPLDSRNLLRVAGASPWGGMPAATVMGHVHLHVGDLERAELFYHRGLGFDKIVWRYPGALFLGAGGYHHHLGTNTWAQGAVAPGGEEARLLEWELVVPKAADAAATLMSLEATGAQVKREAQGGVAGDPWGTSVRVRAAGL